MDGKIIKRLSDNFQEVENCRLKSRWNEPNEWFWRTEFEG